MATSSTLDETTAAFLKQHSKHELVPLPSQLHVQVSAEVIGERDVFLIGDVHGCLDELQNLLQKANVNPTNCLIVFCGDVINKGPKSCETLDYVKKLGALSVRGNHEENVVNDWMKCKISQAKGEEYKPKKKYRWCSDLSENDIQYMMELPYTISFPSLNAVVVHAGLVAGQPLEKQHPYNMVMMRNILDKVGEDGIAIATDEHDVGSSWAHLWPGPQHVYFGHDARRKLQKHAFATGLDTACVMGHELTGVFLKGPRTSELVSVKSQYCKA